MSDAMPAESNSPPVADASDRPGFHYPSVDPGLPALEVSELLNAHQDLIARIKLCFGMDRASFEQSVLPVLQRYAAYVHLLPCTADNYFNEPGGLLQLGLETAFYALQGTDAHIFSGRATISERTALEPRWRQATFVAGLCAELHRPLSQLIVTDQAGHEWSPYIEPLTAWLHDRQVDRYFLKWRPHALDIRSLGLFALPHVLAREDLRALSSDDAPIVPHLLATVAGVQLLREHNALEGLVHRALALVIDRFMQASAERYGKPQLGSHLERYLIDALRRLLASSTNWAPNTDKSRVWFGADGMFLAWPGAADDVRQLLESDQLPGIPKAPKTILEVLLNAGVLLRQEDGSPSWIIHPPGGKPPLDAVKLSTPGILFADLHKLPTALPVPLLTPANAPGRGGPTAGTVEGPSAGLGASPVAAHPSRRQCQDGASKAVAPGQLELPGTSPTELGSERAAPEAAPAPSTALGREAASTSSPPPPQPRLIAPLRLAPMVKDALQDIVATLTLAETEWAACPVESGLFIPLTALTARKLQPPAVVRALQEAHMLEGGASTGPGVGGQELQGVVIAERYIHDLPRRS